MISYALFLLLVFGIGFYMGRKSTRAGERFWMDVAIDAWKESKK